ncbi:MAG: hypothetical protein CMD58_00295 [Gammaproteobacteria bacterium]|nr:hypothetical protein [Gammaproteobacteria bacterium]|tara:strand:- start:1903 stop:2268 length:366 start_codon:yes stop_codon:yes gene_type:complete
MKNLLLSLGLFLAVLMAADDHKSKPQTDKNKMINNPNHLMSFQECKEVKDGIGGLLALSEVTWQAIEKDPENEEKWLEAALIADIAANYSEIYDVWCKDMIAQRMKMRKMMGKKNKETKKE